MNKKNQNGPLVLMILDGWGYREAADDNAISQAHTPHWDQLWNTSTHSLLDTSGLAVGLPEGQMGNSEVGHMNIGAGRIVYQDFTRISKAVADGSFQSNPAMCAAVNAASQAGGTVHIMGLLSAGGVHSHEDHFLAALALAHNQGAKDIVVHAFLDGRDTPPRSAEPSIQRMQAAIDAHPGARFGSVIGRYYAMDRDQRWERVESAWNALAGAEGVQHAQSAAEALLNAYARDENDEFVAPTVLQGHTGIHDGDAVLFVNFRADRAREITRAFVEPGFQGFKREAPDLSAFVSMTEYQAGLPVTIAFPADDVTGTLGEIIAAHHMTQLRISETEKYAHVTFFLNGGRETPFEGEQRIMIPSPQVATYDLQPEMSAPELTRALVKAIEQQAFDVIICNVANPDMVGHSGKLDAAIAAVEAVDLCLGAVWQALQACEGAMLVTADHGNVEQMQDASSGQTHTAHTTNPVPFVYAGPSRDVLENGSLRDIAPTMLKLLGLPQASAMTGRCLLNPKAAQH